MDNENLGVFFAGNYLLQGNQFEKCRKAAKLNAGCMELVAKTDKINYDIKSINNLKDNYKGNIFFHLPSVNPDLSNLKIINEIARNLKLSGIELVTINASNLSLDLFEWSTLEEQKKYFLNIVTSIATIASNKIEVAIDNMLYQEGNSVFGCNISQITDVIVYSRKMLIKDFGFRESETEKYIGLALNIDNIDTNSDREKLGNWLEVYRDSIKCIKISDTNKIDDINLILDYSKNRNTKILLKTKSDLDEIDTEYYNLLNYVNKDESMYISVDKQSVSEIKRNKKYSNYIIIGIIVITVVILYLMLIYKLR